MNQDSEFPFDRARRVTPEEHQHLKDALAEQFGIEPRGQDQSASENAVPESHEDLSAQQETDYLNSISGMSKSLHQAAAEPIEECTNLENLDW